MKLEPLPTYVTERELRAAFKQQHAGILGALLDMMARGLAMLPTTKLISPPRMADFATWAVACGVERFEDHSTIFLGARLTAFERAGGRVGCGGLSVKPLAIDPPLAAASAASSTSQNWHAACVRRAPTRQ